MMLTDPSNTRLCSCPYHSVAARKSGQPHSVQVKQSDLSIVMWQSDDPLVGRDAYPKRSHQLYLKPQYVFAKEPEKIFFSVAAYNPHVTYLFTAESVRMVAIGDLMFFKSHTLTVRSSLPDTTLSPTVNTADVTVLQKNNTQRNTHNQRPVVT